MQLKDLLSNDVINRLEGINKKDNVERNKKKKKGESKIDKNKQRVNKSHGKKVKSSYEDKYCKEYKERKRYIEECPYCASTDLEVVGNGYYYCTYCGIKVEKR